MRVQSSRRIRNGDAGYAMVALLVAMSVMAVMMSVALPVWSTAARREKEAELIFRGEQYARAIALFQRRYGNAFPPSVDVLVEQRFLRKKYKDPITGEDFRVLSPGMPIPGIDEPPESMARGGRGQEDAQERTQRARELLELRSAAQRAQAAGRGRAVLQPRGAGVIGVVSTSTERSLRRYNGRDRYNEWVFLGTQMSNQAGAGAPGGAVPGGRGGAVPGVPTGPVPGRGGQRLTLPPIGGRGGPPVINPFGRGGRRGAPPPDR